MAFSVVLFDDYARRDNLLPLVATRPIANLRVGILTIDQKWELIFEKEISYKTVPYLREKFPLSSTLEDEVIIIRSAVLPNSCLVSKILELNLNEVLVNGEGDWLALKTTCAVSFTVDYIESFDKIYYSEELSILNYPEDIFLNNATQLSYDLTLLKANIFDLNQGYGYYNRFIGDQVYIQSNVMLHGVILDSTKGPIYIGENSVLEAGVVINGPCSVGENCRLKSGTVLYPNVSIGKNTVISGELNNVVIWGNSAKGHYGYLGCAVIGEGCNLGAGTTNSNLKNDWTTVKVYNYADGHFRDTGLLKCGVFIGDHVMLAIQSILTTGTVIGVGSQIAMSKFIPKFVPDFSWITDDKEDIYLYNRFESMIRNKAKIKNETLKEECVNILRYLYSNNLTT